VSEAVPFFYDTNKRVVIELEDGMVVGRNKDCDIAVVDHKVSGKHFEVHINDGEVTIVDLESSNKTKLNGESLSPQVETKLNIKDNVKFGSQKFLYFYENIEDFVVPEITATLQIRSTAQCADELFAPSSLQMEGGVNLDPKKSSKPKISELKNSKVKLDQIEANLKQSLEDIEEFKRLQESVENIESSIRVSKDQLKDSNYNTKEEISEDIKSFEFSISELNELINEAKNKIQTWNIEIAKINQSIIESKHLSEVFDDIEDLKVQKKELSDRISSQSEESLLEAKDELQSEFELEQEKYKNLQANYSLGLSKKKSA
jgi:pSer/pThr/pTyr-binding forkhead associated (FHA) protein